MALYLLGVNFDGGEVTTPMEEWKPEEVDGPPRLLPGAEQGARGQRRARADRDPRRARPREDRHAPTATRPVVTDGPFQEFKEWLAGFQIVDVETEERALEIAARLSAVPGPGGVADAAADPGPAGSWKRRRGRRGDGRVPRARGRRPLSDADRCRGPAARARAAGPRRARPAVRRLRRCRGRRAGGAARGGAALAAGRRAGGAARLADPDRDPPADRPVAQRPVPAGARGARGDARAGARRGLRPRRRARRAVHVLPPVADAGVGDRAHAARGRRPDDRGDRAARSSSPRRRWPSGSRARRRRIKASGAPFALPAPRSERPASCGRSCTSST